MTLWRGLVVSVLDFGTRGLGSIPGMAPFYRFFSSRFCVLMLNCFKKVIWNYKKANNFTP